MAPTAVQVDPCDFGSLTDPNSGKIAPKKASRQILLHEIEEGIDALERPVIGLFCPAFRLALTWDSACFSWLSC